MHVFEHFANITLITHDSVIESTECDVANLAQTKQLIRELNTCYDETRFNRAVIPRWICAESVLKPLHLLCHVWTKVTNPITL